MVALTLTKLFGSSPQVQVLEVLASYPGQELSVPFLDEHVQSSKATIYKYVNELRREGMVVETSKVGKTQFFTLNLQDVRARLIAALQNQLISDNLTALIHAEGYPTLTEEVAGEVEGAAVAQAV